MASRPDVLEGIQQPKGSQAAPDPERKKRKRLWGWIKEVMPDVYETAKTFTGAKKECSEPEAGQVTTSSVNKRPKAFRKRNSMEPKFEVTQTVVDKANSGEPVSEDAKGKDPESLAAKDTATNADKRASIFEKGVEKSKDMARRLTLTFPVSKPKQKDPLHQWMVDHSGGTVRDR
ncbi:hypothetical protein AAE478_004548 [Parahypoxylon ruwenzoriense]